MKKNLEKVTNVIAKAYCIWGLVSMVAIVLAWAVPKMYQAIDAIHSHVRAYKKRVAEEHEALQKELQKIGEAQYQRIINK